MRTWLQINADFNSDIVRVESISDTAQMVLKKYHSWVFKSLAIFCERVLIDKTSRVPLQMRFYEMAEPDLSNKPA